MDKNEKIIGANIREVRLAKGLSQEALAEMCDFSNTTLSAYENGRKVPGLATLARIAKQLNVAIERLYYGDENSAFIDSEPDVGKKIVNSVYLLWSVEVINCFEDFYTGMYGNLGDGKKDGPPFYFQKYYFPIKRLIGSLNEFERNKVTYSNPEKYIEMLKASVAAEINNEIKKDSENTKKDNKKERKA